MTGTQVALVIFALVFGGSSRLHAQSPSPLQEWQYASGIVLRKLFEPQIPTWEIVLGASGIVQPLYDGARPYHVELGPTINIRYEDVAFLSTGEGLGLDVFRGANYRAGIALGYDLGRRVAEYPSHLHGLGNIEPAPAAKLFAAYAVSKEFPVVIRADARRILGGSDGIVGDLSAYLPLPGSSRKLAMFAGPSLTFADATYMQNTFGVGQAQSIRSGLPRLKARAGLKSTGFGLSATWFVAKHWLLNGEAALTRLLDSAVRSPITQSAVGSALAMTIAYRF